MQHINSFMGGMKGGVDYTIIPQDSYLYLLNGCIISRDDHGFVITSVKGTEQIASFDANEVPIGSTSFNGILYIITHKIDGSDAFICFYSYKGSNGTTWVNDMALLPNGVGSSLSVPQSLLGYSRMKLLQVFAKESYDGSVDLYICDGLSPNSVVNTGIDSDGKMTERIYLMNSPIEFALQRSVTKVPDVDSSIRQSGNLKPGTYYFYIRYEDQSMNSTPFVCEHGPVFIHSGSFERDNAVGVLNEDNAKVSKSIILNISNTDPLYSKVSVAVVHYFGYDLVLSRDNYIIDKSFSLIGNKATIVINGDNATRSITVEEIVADNLQYNTSETHLQLDNRYYGANWSGNSIDFANLKELAMRIIPHSIINSTEGFDDIIDENTDEFEYMEDEIYPFGVVFLIDGRYKTPVFPISGWYEGEQNMSSYISLPDDPRISVYGHTIKAKSVVLNVRIDRPNDSIVFESVGLLISAGKTPTQQNHDMKIVLGRNTDIIGHVRVDGLLKDTVYHVTGFAEDTADYYFTGNVFVFTTMDGVIRFKPLVAKDQSPISEYVESEITTDGGDDIVRRGVCWSTSNDSPDINDMIKNAATIGIGKYIQDITGLDMGTPHFMKSFAENSFGIYYSSMTSFVTMRGSEILTIINIDIAVSSISVLISIEPGSGGFPTVYACMSMSPNPEYRPDTWCVLGVSQGPDVIATFYGTFKSGDVYYIRAYSVNEYSQDYSMQSEITIPYKSIHIQTDKVNTVYVTSTSAKCSGRIISIDNTTLKKYGICYSTTGTPTIFDSIVEITYDSETYTPLFECFLTELIDDFGYIFRAYAIDYYDEIFYGDAQSFWTREFVPNKISLNSLLTVLTKTTAQVSGTLDLNGENTVIDKGVIYKENMEPTMSNYLGKIISSNTPGNFTVLIEGLIPGRFYYAIPFVTLNDIGTLLGLSITFRTKS